MFFRSQLKKKTIDRLSNVFELVLVKEWSSCVRHWQQPESDLSIFIEGKWEIRKSGQSLLNNKQKSIQLLQFTKDRIFALAEELYTVKRWCIQVLDEFWKFVNNTVLSVQLPWLASLSLKRSHKQHTSPQFTRIYKMNGKLVRTLPRFVPFNRKFTCFFT